MSYVFFKPLSANQAKNILNANTGNVRKYFEEFNNLESVTAWIKDTLHAIERGEKEEFIIFNELNDFVGMIAIWRINSKTGEISLWIKESMQNKGYGKLAMKLLLSRYSNGYSKLEYRSDTDNAPSINLAQSLNFKRIDNEEDISQYLFIKFI